MICRMGYNHEQAFTSTSELYVLLNFMSTFELDVWAFTSTSEPSRRRLSPMSSSEFSRRRLGFHVDVRAFTSTSGLSRRRLKVLRRRLNDVEFCYKRLAIWPRVCTCSKHQPRCYLPAAGLCEFSSTFVFLSDRDEFVSTASTRDW